MVFNSGQASKCQTSKHTSTGLNLPLNGHFRSFPVTCF